MRALAIDLGLRRIGLALSDPTGTIARPWRTLRADGPIEEDLRRLLEIVAELRREPDGLAAIVVGLPRRLDGSPTELTARAQALAAALETRTALPVILQDERLTSREAEARLAGRERSWRRRKAKIDAAAAAVILQDYLDHRPRP
ncbi:MAG TPA: Holliday junction resolvase RuvX [Vicinamibacterales bacterium]|nr:Holliday junction resolvase RuvX [Vicinamibacterales bacterium]